MGLSITHLLKDAGVAGGSLRKATKELAEEAENVHVLEEDERWGETMKP